MPKTEHYQWYTEQFAPTELHAHAVDEIYYAGRTAFQAVAVMRTAAFGKLLVLDGDTQSSQTDEKIYHESLVHPAMAAANERAEVLILGGGEGATLREVLRDATVRGLLPKVTCAFDPEIEAEFPANMSGKLTVAARGQSFVQKVVVPKGEPSNFLTEAELRAKFTPNKSALSPEHDRAAR